MPTKSPAQHRLMEAVAHDPEVARKTGIPQSVGKEFVAADSDDARARVFNAHFGADVPALLKPKTTRDYVQEHLAMHQSLSNK